MVTLSPGLAGRPLPLTMSSVTSLRGGEPVGFGISGLVLVSLSQGLHDAGLGLSLGRPGAVAGAPLVVAPTPRCRRPDEDEQQSETQECGHERREA